MDDQVTVTLTKDELETMLYALEIAEADCVESASDGAALPDDRTTWHDAAEEMRVLRPKLLKLAA
jgi:hypothetical protein